jgi:FixJ family two-component response regulator
VAPLDDPLIGILDDEEHFRRALTRLLQAHDYRIMDFASGPEFLAEAQRRRFDCLLLDLAMPGMSGFDVLEAMRDDPRSPPAIVITGIEDEDVFKRARELNAFECHAKPIRDEVLVAAIRRALGR